MTEDLTRSQEPIPPRHLAGNLAVRTTCGRYVGRYDGKPISRPTLLYWRERHGFPAPLDAPRAGVELWDIREVREWARAYVAMRAEQERARLEVCETEARKAVDAVAAGADIKVVGSTLHRP